MRKPRRLRHWKQRFDPNAKFIWRTCKLFAGKMTEPGKPLPKKFTDDPRNRNKLRMLWEAGHIELAQFDNVKNVATGERESASNKDGKDKKQSKKPAKIEKATKLGKGQWIASNDLEEQVFKTKKEAVAFYDELAEKSEEVLNDDTPMVEPEPQDDEDEDDVDESEDDADEDDVDEDDVDEDDVDVNEDEDDEDDLGL